MARVLWLSSETPDRHGQGGQRRQFHQIRELVELGHDITVLCPTSPQDHTSVAEFAAVERPRIAVRGRLIPWLVAKVRKRIEAGGWDRIVVSHIESMWLLPPHRGTAPVLVDVHNVMSDWYARRGLTADQALWHSQESDAIVRADAIATCSSEERRRLLAQHPGVEKAVIVAPLGVDPAEWPEAAWDRSLPLVSLFGSWGWHPNKAGLHWFRTAVWPLVHEKMPEARAVVAGTGTTSEDWPDGLEYVGRVDDLVELTSRSTVVAVPVWEGVGASVKFAESLASGASVIATPDGANAFDESGAYVSADADDWAEWIVARLKGRNQAAVPDPARADAVARLTWKTSVHPIDAWLAGGPGST